MTSAHLSNKKDYFFVKKNITKGNGAKVKIPSEIKPLLPKLIAACGSE